MERETVRHRVYAVRLALGDGWKTPMSGEAFAALLSKRLKRRYDGAMISRMENGARKISLDEVEAIAALDPKKRGPSWLAFGETAAPARAELPDLEPQISGTLTDEQKEASRARRAARKKKGNSHGRAG